MAVTMGSTERRGFVVVQVQARIARSFPQPDNVHDTIGQARRTMDSE
jgi:hypothetical protein